MNFVSKCKFCFTVSHVHLHPYFFLSNEGLSNTMYVDEQYE
jgi:hypothetical protein